MRLQITFTIGRGFTILDIYHTRDLGEINNSMSLNNTMKMGNWGFHIQLADRTTTYVLNLRNPWMQRKIPQIGLDPSIKILLSEKKKRTTFLNLAKEACSTWRNTL